MRSKKQWKLWVEMNIPILIKPKGRTNKEYVFPFSSANAMKKVIDFLAEKLYLQERK